MNREESSKRRGELMGEKLKRGILLGKREGNSTPSPTWKFGLIQPDGTLIQDFNFSPNSSNPLSARKLGANLWEMKPQFNLRLNNINGPSFTHHEEEEISRVHKELDDKPLQSPSKQPISGVNSREQIAASLSEYNLRVEKVAQAQQPLSLASYCSSMEMAPHRPAAKADGSLVCNGKLGQSSHSLKTSTELLKVLNRIWSLEEKHALDMSLVKTLRRELDQSKACIQELLQGKERNREEIGTLMKQVTEYKVSKKEQDRIKESVKLVESKLEHEVKLRRHSEKSLNKLAKELSEMKSLFSNALREIEHEKKARALIEGLCDEFAKGIKEYEQEVRLMKQKSPEDQIGREGNDRLTLHMCEAWLDERAQTKLQDAHGYDISEKHSALDKLCVEIEAFLQAKQSDNTTKNDYKGTMSHSLESIHLNEPASAPWKGNDEDDSISTGNRCSQFCRGANLKQANASMRQQQGEITSDDRYKGTTKTKPASKRVQIQSRTISDPSSSKRQSEDGLSKSRMENSYDIRSPRFAGPPSPVKRWTSEVLTADPDISESSSSRWQESIKPNTLKAKLMEARLDGQRSRARISRGSSQVD